MSGLALSLSFALAAGTLPVAPSESADNVTEVVHEALAVVGQQTDERDTVEVVEGVGTTAHAQTDAGAFAVTTEPGVDTALIHHDDGMQVIAVLDDGATHTTYDLAVPEEVEIVQAGDGYEFVLQEEAGRITLGEIEAPWAVDANGQQVETSYELVGQRLVQHIEGDVAYPVVADPKLTFGVGVYLNMWGFEMRAAATAIVAAGGAAAAATCALSNVPASLVTLTKLLCGAVATPTVTSIYATILDIWRTEVDNNSCYQGRIVGGAASEQFVKVSTDNCG